MGLDLTKIIIALIVLVNPISAVPLFLSLTSEYTPSERKSTAITTALAIFLGISFCAVLGNYILQLMNISIGSFQIGGGILVLLIAISMMNAKPSPTKTNKEEAAEAGSKESIAVVPLAIPLLIGPGSISTVIIYSASAHNIQDFVKIILAGLVIALLCLLTMSTANHIEKFLGKTGINIINRIMGMLLSAVSIEIIVSGLKALFPMLK